MKTLVACLAGILLGVAPMAGQTVTLSSTSLGFGKQEINTPSVAMTVNLTAGGTANRSISSIAITGTSDFAETNNCPASLAPAAKCTITVTYTPTVLGAESASITVADNASTSPQTVALSGTGVAPVTFSATFLSFGSVGQGNPSTSQNLKVTNNQAVTLGVSKITLSNPDYTEADNCVPTVAAKSTCTIVVTLTPSNLGTDNGSLTVSYNASNSQTVSLTGRGVAPVTLSATPLSFGSVGQGNPSTSQTLVVTNNQAVTLGVSKITLSNPDYTETDNCVGTVAAKGTCSISVTLTPSNLGTDNGSLSVIDNASNSPQTASLTGTGAAPVTFSVTSLSFGNVEQGNPSTSQTLKVNNNQAVTLSVSKITLSNTDYTETDNCIGTVAAKGTCSITVTLTPSILGTDNGSLSVTDNASNSPQTASLTGTGVTPVTFSATFLSFGHVVMNSHSSSQNLKVTNNQAVTLSVSKITLSNPDYTETDNCAGTVAAKGTCTIVVTLTPSNLGTDNGSLTVTDNASNSPQTVSLTGTGLAPVTLSATLLNFSNVGENSPSAPQTIKLTNNQAAALSLPPASITMSNPDFAQTNACNGSVAGNGTCTFTVTFTPSTLTAETGTLTFTDAASNSPQTVSLTGTGVIQVTVTPTSLSFAPEPLGTTSAATKVTLTNNLSTVLSIGITLTGPDPGDFGQTNTCGTSLAANSHCTISVTFTPVSAGPRSATMNVKDSADNSPQTVALAGAGSQVSFSPTALGFGNQGLDITSAPLTETVSNPGTANLTISSVTFGGADAGDFAKSTDTCTGATVAPNQTCTVIVTFRPAATGSRSATLSFADNAANSPQGVPLTGTGTEPTVSFSAPGLSFAPQSASTTSSALMETVTNTGNGILHISTVTISGSNAGDFTKGTDNCSGASVAPYGTCTVSATFTPSTTGSRSAALNFPDDGPDTPQTVPLSGIGTGSPVGFSAPALTFVSQSLSTMSGALTETVTNTGTGNLVLSSVTIGGTNAGDFAMSTNTCYPAPYTLTPNGTCTVSVTFTPSATGSRSAALNFATNASGSPQAVSLVGLGIGPLAAVLTQRYDNARSGQNTQEVYLTPSNVTESQFGKLFALPVDGQVYAQPLYMENVSIPNVGAHNVIFVATQNDSVYAFDADTPSATPLWQVSFVNPAAGVTIVPCQDVYGTGACDINPQIGITSTPVIDPTTGTLYVTAKTKELQNPPCTSNCTYDYFYRLHALDITTGAEKFGGPVTITASVHGVGAASVGGVVTFNPLRHLQRPGLLLLNGMLYIGFGSHGDITPYHGWLMAYNATTLQQVAVFNVTPNSGDGALWGGGGGISVDENGYIYLVTANGSFDANTGGVDYSDSVLKLQLQSGQFQVLDYFTPANQATLDAEDLDLGSSPALILPDQPGPYPHLLATGGKDGRVWLLNRDNLGHLQTNDAGAVQILPGLSDKLFGGVSYWNGNLYVQELGDYLFQFPLENGLTQTPTSSESEFGGFPNSPPAVSANGTSNAVLWLVRPGSVAAVLYGFDATNVANEIYTSSQAPGNRDQAGPSVKFVIPTIANGKVYVGAAGEVDVYGLLP